MQKTTRPFSTYVAKRGGETTKSNCNNYHSVYIKDVPGPYSQVAWILYIIMICNTICPQVAWPSYSLLGKKACMMAGGGGRFTVSITCHSPSTPRLKKAAINNTGDFPYAGMWVPPPPGLRRRWVGPQNTHMRRKMSSLTPVLICLLQAIFLQLS